MSILVSTHEFPTMARLADEHLTLSDQKLTEAAVSSIRQTDIPKNRS